jgi:DnaJ homolog subfamily A member 2
MHGDQYATTRNTCPECKGSKTIVKEKDRCKKCKGKKTVAEKKRLDVEVEPGMTHGERITLQGEGDRLVELFGLSV